LPRGTRGAGAAFYRRMPLLIIVLIAILIAQIGFWDTLGAVLGATAMLLLLVLLIVAVAALSIRQWFVKIRRGL